MFDRIRKIATSAALRALTPNSIPVAYSADTDEICYKDEGGTVRKLATLDGTQALSGKTLTAPLFTVSEYLVDGALSIATGVHVLTKSSGAGAYTLAAPTAAQKGTILFITSRTAQAHVITATNLINDGVGPTLDTITFDAQPGASVILVADNLLWYVLSANATVAIAGA